MQIELLNDQGQAASKFDAPETLFGRDYNEDLIHQIVVAYQANARQGTRAQKDREQVKHFPYLAWRRSRFPQQPRRKLHPKNQQKDVPCWHGVHLFSVGA